MANPATQLLLGLEFLEQVLAGAWNGTLVLKRDQEIDSSGLFLLRDMVYINKLFDYSDFYRGLICKFRTD